jgi:hypothetical protein
MFLFCNDDIDELKKEIEKQYFFYFDDYNKFIPSLKYCVVDIKKTMSIKKSRLKRISVKDVPIEKEMITKKFNNKLNDEIIQKLLLSKKRLFEESDAYEVEIKINNEEDYNDEYNDFVGGLDKPKFDKLFLKKYNIYLDVDKQKLKELEKDYVLYKFIKNDKEYIDLKYIVKRKRMLKLNKYRVLGYHNNFEKSFSMFRTFVRQTIKDKANKKNVDFLDIIRRDYNFNKYFNYIEKNILMN